MGWGGGSVDNDPKQIWHSSSIAGSGSNFVSYSNKEVDTLIEKARMTLNKDKRVGIMRSIYKKIADDVPYLFLFNSKFGFYGHTKKMKGPQDTFTYGIGTDYWWVSK